MNPETIAALVAPLKDSGLDFTKIARGKIILELTWKERFGALFRGKVVYDQSYDEAKEAVAGFESSFIGMGIEFEPYVSQVAKPAKLKGDHGASGSIGFLKE